MERSKDFELGCFLNTKLFCLLLGWLILVWVSLKSGCLEANEVDDDSSGALSELMENITSSLSIEIAPFLLSEVLDY